MKAQDYQAALTLYAEADQRATAALLELAAATVLRKITPPEGEAVVTVSLTPDDLEQTVADYLVDTHYGEDSEMTVFVTKLARK